MADFQSNLLAVLLIVLAVAIYTCLKRKKEPTAGASAPPSRTKKTTGFAAIADRFRNIEELQEGLKKCGLESSNLIVGTYSVLGSYAAAN
jgi:hypothetical protein